MEGSLELSVTDKQIAELLIRSVVANWKEQGFFTIDDNSAEMKEDGRIFKFEPGGWSEGTGFQGKTETVFRGTLHVDWDEDSENGFFPFREFSESEINYRRAYSKANVSFWLESDGKYYAGPCLYWIVESCPLTSMTTSQGMYCATTHQFPTFYRLSEAATEKMMARNAA